MNKDQFDQLINKLIQCTNKVLDDIMASRDTTSSYSIIREVTNLVSKIMMLESEYSQIHRT